VTAHLSPAARARARRLDQALDTDRSGRGHNRDRAAQQPPSHADPGSRTLPGTHGRIADAQPNQHRPTPTAPAPAPAARPAVSPGAPPAAPTPTSPAGGDSGGPGAP
jgi:hypothetical protein